MQQESKVVVYHNPSSVPKGVEVSHLSLKKLCYFPAHYLFFDNPFIQTIRLLTAECIDKKILSALFLEAKEAQSESNDMPPLLPHDILSLLGIFVGIQWYFHLFSSPSDAQKLEVETLKSIEADYFISEHDRSRKTHNPNIETFHVEYPQLVTVIKRLEKLLAARIFLDKQHLNDQERMKIKEDPFFRMELENGFTHIITDLKTIKDIQNFYDDFIQSDFSRLQRNPITQSFRSYLIPERFNPRLYSTMTIFVIELIQQRVIKFLRQDSAFNPGLSFYICNNGLEKFDIDAFSKITQKIFDPIHTKNGVNPKYTKQLEEFLSKFNETTQAKDPSSHRL